MDTPTRSPGAAPPPALRISCNDCAMQGSSACDDCLVTFICSRDANDAVVLNLDEHRALRRLAASGLVPEVRHQPIHDVR